MTFILAYWSFSSSKSTSVSNNLIQVATFATKVSATYSVFINNKATITRFLEY